MFSEIKIKSAQFLSNPNTMTAVRLAILAIMAIAVLLFPEAAQAEPLRGGMGG